MIADWTVEFDHARRFAFDQLYRSCQKVRFNVDFLCLTKCISCKINTKSPLTRIKLLFLSLALFVLVSGLGIRLVKLQFFFSHSTFCSPRFDVVGSRTSRLPNEKTERWLPEWHLGPVRNYNPRESWFYKPSIHLVLIDFGIFSLSRDCFVWQVKSRHTGRKLLQPRSIPHNPSRNIYSKYETLSNIFIYESRFSSEYFYK